MASHSRPSHKAGLPPGSLIHIGSIPEHETRISVIDYSTETVAEKVIESVSELLPYRDSDTVTWINVEGLADTSVIKDIGEMFGIHQLVLEDILNTHQRPKFEEFEGYLFIVLKALLSEGKEFSVSYEQISILVLEKLIFTFKEKKDEVLAPVQQRIRTSKGRFRSLGSDFQNFILIDALDEAITVIEDQLLDGEPGNATLNSIQRLKREIVGARRFISPIRELVSQMLRSESPLIDEKTHIYLRDVSDHVIRIIESIELHRDITSGLLDIYISSVSNRMNEVMKVLTVFASIFIPMTFLTGIYGMNFAYMPELNWHWAYPALWCVFISIPTVLLVYFKRKKWL
jgi:magnesium transporter